MNWGGTCPCPSGLDQGVTARTVSVQRAGAGRAPRDPGVRGALPLRSSPQPGTVTDAASLSAGPHGRTGAWNLEAFAGIGSGRGPPSCPHGWSTMRQPGDSAPHDARHCHSASPSGAAVLVDQVLGHTLRIHPPVLWSQVLAGNGQKTRKSQERTLRAGPSSHVTRRAWAEAAEAAGGVGRNPAWPWPGPAFLGGWKL